MRMPLPAQKLECRQGNLTATFGGDNLQIGPFPLRESYAAVRTGRAIARSGIVRLAVIFR